MKHPVEGMLSVTV